MSNNQALFPGTFDPITHGHLDIIRRGAKLFDKLIIAIADSPTKKAWFSLEERVALARQEVSELSNVEVIGFSGLLADLAKQQRTNIILRSIRTTQDFEYESQLAKMNHHLINDAETLFLMPSSTWGFISSSLIKEVALHQGDITPFVSSQVKQKLLQRITERQAKEDKSTTE